MASAGGSKGPAMKPEKYVLLPTSYVAYVSPTGLEFIKKSDGEFVLGTNEAGQQHGSEPVVSVGGVIGKIEEFKVNLNWKLYSERLEQYFNANFIDDHRKVALLITAIGPEVYKILSDLCSPTLSQTETYLELCDVLKKYFSPHICF